MTYDSGGNTIEDLCLSKGFCLLTIVSCGDCGVDVGCLMMGPPPDFEHRTQLREDTSLSNETKTKTTSEKQHMSLWIVLDIYCN